MQILYADWTVTYTDNKKGNWATINNKGVRRVRKQGDVHDHKVRIELQEKIDPETNSIIKVRKDGVLIVRHENDLTETTDVAVKFPNIRFVCAYDLDIVVLQNFYIEEFYVGSPFVHEP